MNAKGAYAKIGGFAVAGVLTVLLVKVLDLWPPGIWKHRQSMLKRLIINVSTEMLEDEFWELIEEARKMADCAKCSEGIEFGSDFFIEEFHELVKVLSRRTPDEIRAFDDVFYAMMRKANRWDPLAAAYLLGEGLGGDDFSLFRECLISLGKERYYRVLEDPDSLAEIAFARDVPYLFSDGFYMAAGRAYEVVTGEEMDYDEPIPDGEPTGEAIDFSDEVSLRKRFPRLYAAAHR
ncbi:MAG TPA: DUF4240 domain-containing protein [Verrucomicrobiales bacterium]|nr:DUF4240 domain-containing protein [Verrucomicrobiales bacterium]